jgi:DNA-binding transcriptional regulator YbjK
MLRGTACIGHTTDVVSTLHAEITDRRTVVADAALTVLEVEGGRGLTHRRVDREAGLVEGSTSNYFSTREALLTGALHRLVELEEPTMKALEALVPYGPYDARRAAELVTAQIHGWLEPERRGREVARYELSLEARRRPEFRAALNEVRTQFLARTEELLPAVGCRSPREHAPPLLAALDGLMVNQLLQPATTLSREQIVGYLERLFATC